MLILRRQPRGLRVVRLTPELAAALRTQAQEALNGDGTCSLKTMTTSCFASETCAHGDPSGMHLGMLLAQPHAFVAVSDLAPDGETRLHEDAFVGCVSCGPTRTSLAATLFPDLGTEGVVLSNLCVASPYRKRNVGRLLVDKVLGLGHEQTYLLVARGTERTPEIAEAFRERVARLRATYAKLGFRAECECERAVLFRHSHI